MAKIVLEKVIYNPRAKRMEVAVRADGKFRVVDWYWLDNKGVDECGLPDQDWWALVCKEIRYRDSIRETDPFAAFGDTVSK